MSFEQWKEEAAQMGMNVKDTREYITRKQEEHARAIEYEREREERAHELELKKMSDALELKKMSDAREREKEAHELQLAQLQAAANGPSNSSVTSQAPAHVASYGLTKFSAKDGVEAFIARFEVIAEALQYDETTKRLQFMGLFDGEALEVIHRLDPREREYEHLKKAIIDAYGQSADVLEKKSLQCSD